MTIILGLRHNLGLPHSSRTQTLRPIHRAMLSFYSGEHHLYSTAMTPVQNGLVDDEGGHLY